MTDELKTFIDTYKTLENEIKMLQEDKKNLIDYLQETHGISPKVIRKAIQVAKIRTAMGDEITQLDNIVELTEGNDWQDYIYNKLIVLKCELERQYTNLTGYKYDEYMNGYWSMNTQTKEMEYHTDE